MADIWHPKFRSQLGKGTPVPGGTRGSLDCGVRAVQHGIAGLTHGQLIVPVPEIRDRMNREGAEPTNTTDAERCVDSFDAEMARYDRRPLQYVRLRGELFLQHLIDASKSGEGVQWAIDYGTFNRLMHRLGLRTGDPGYDDGHSIYTQGWRRAKGRIFLFGYDSLDDHRRSEIPQGPRWIPASPIIGAWEAFGHFSGIFRGGERTL